MSLVITAWDKTIGIAVSEGRAIANVNGIKVPVSESQTKLSRLPDGSILGLTGGLRDGYQSTKMREAHVTDPLRRAIHAQAEAHTFREMRTAVIPRLFAEFTATYPEMGFGVSLLGTEDGTIRGAAWSSDGSVYDPADGSGVRASILGLSASANAEATAAVSRHFADVGCGFLRLTSAQALAEIIRDLARRHVELNDRVQFEIVAVNAEADGFCLNTLEPKEAGSDVTANHILTSVVEPLNAFNITSTLQAIPSYGWTVAASGPSDVYNIYATFAFGSNGIPVTLMLCLDGNTSSPLSSRGLYSSLSTQSLVFSVTGLAAGSHTLQFYANHDSGFNDTALEAVGLGTSGMCQRIF